MTARACNSDKGRRFTATAADERWIGNAALSGFYSALVRSVHTAERLLADTADYTNDPCTLEAAVAIAQDRRGEVGRQGKCDRGASRSQISFYRTVAFGQEASFAVTVAQTFSRLLKA